MDFAAEVDGAGLGQKTQGDARHKTEIPNLNKGQKLTEKQKALADPRQPALWRFAANVLLSGPTL